MGHSECHKRYKIFEIKQEPYVEEDDKEDFNDKSISTLDL